MKIATLHPVIEAPPNNPAVEFLFDACEGQPPVRQKRLIVRAALVGIVSEQDAGIVMDALNLRLA